MDGCGHTSARWLSWMMPLPPLTRPNGSRERRSSAFIRKELFRGKWLNCNRCLRRSAHQPINYLTVQMQKLPLYDVELLRMVIDQPPNSSCAKQSDVPAVTRLDRKRHRTRSWRRDTSRSTANKSQDRCALRRHLARLEHMVVFRET